ncbi:glycosyltransferase [Dehalococcoidales bacterium]|nr:glycosyltransferase [Dehalococcoidales bacterium]
MNKLTAEKLPFISVIVPTYNEERFLPSCLESLKRQDYGGDYEVIVVDNASSDRTAEIAFRLGAKVVFEGRRSPSSARQRGLLEARGEIVAFIDADSIAPRQWLTTIVRRFANPQIVAVTGPCVFFDAGVFIRTIPYLGIILDHAFRWLTRKGGALWGSNFAARRKILLEVGGFNTSIKFRGEDIELSLRLKEKGKLSLIPSLFVLTSARRLKEEGIWCALWNYIICYLSVLFCPLPERFKDIPKQDGKSSQLD